MRYPKLTLIILILIFVVPMLAAGYLYVNHGDGFSSTNKGKLLSPALTSPVLAGDKGHWVLLYVAPSCDKLCDQNLYKMRQIRLATGKNQTRIKTLSVTDGSLHFQTGLYIADPIGNIILYYAPDANTSGILKDLTKLLRVSQIG